MKKLICAFILSASATSFAAQTPFRFCRTIGGHENTLITIWENRQGAIQNFPEDLVALSIQRFDGAITSSEEYKYEMKVETDFNKGATFRINLQHETGNPGSLFMDFGSGVFAIALYTTPLSSISGLLKCTQVNPFKQ